jgi:hypothetical protein
MRGRLESSINCNERSTEGLDVTIEETAPLPTTAPPGVSLSTEIEDPRLLPAKFVRIGRRGKTWNLPRRFCGYKAVSTEQLSVRGAAPKFILRANGDTHDWYIVKSAEKWGATETLSELLNNVLGMQLGFPMAPAGILRADRKLHFASKNFQRENETLIHGSLLFEEIFEDQLDGVGKKRWDEQRTFDLDLIKEMLDARCGDDGGKIFSDLLQMMIFDALIGSMDRHMQNWGLIATVGEPRVYRFSPIFDSARALLWNCDESKLELLETNRSAFDAYINRAQPIMGCASTGKAVNHFELVDHLLMRYPEPVGIALERIRPEKVQRAARVVREFPFTQFFTRRRRTLITKVLTRRAEMLHQRVQARLTSQEGGS